MLSFYVLFVCSLFFVWCECYAVCDSIFATFVRWLLDISATCLCISGTGLLKQLHGLSH